MGTFKEKIRNAFAVDPAGPAVPTKQQRVAIDFLAEEIARRHMTTPAIAMIEMSRPMNYVFSQAMHFTQPAATIVTKLISMMASQPDLESGNGEAPRPRLTAEDWTPIAEFFEHRGSFDYVCSRIEHFESVLDEKHGRHSLKKNKMKGSPAKAAVDDDPIQYGKSGQHSSE